MTDVQDRTQPAPEQAHKALRRFADGFASPPRSPVLHSPAEHGLDYQDVTFPAGDGVPLEPGHARARAIKVHRRDATDLAGAEPRRLHSELNESAAQAGRQAAALVRARLDAELDGHLRAGTARRRGAGRRSASALRRVVGQSWRAGFGLQPGGASGEANGVIPAAHGDHVEDLCRR